MSEITSIIKNINEKGQYENVIKTKILQEILVWFLFFILKSYQLFTLLHYHKKIKDPLYKSNRF